MRDADYHLSSVCPLSADRKGTVVMLTQRSLFSPEALDP